MGGYMENYDVVIVGGGLGSLTTATYLSKRLRNVAVFEEGKRKKLQKYSKRFKDSENNKYEFKFYNYDLGGVHEGDLFFEYIKRCGLQTEFQYFDNNYVMIVNKDKRLKKRPNDAKNFKTYLVRQYPKQRDNIHKLFSDILRHAGDYKEQKLLRLKNKEHTLPSLLIEWGDLSLQQVLNKYVNNDEIINEFSLVYDSIGIPVDEINAYNYFIKWFDTFIDGSHFIKTSYDNIVKTFTKEISKTKDKIFTNRKIDKFIIEDGTIKMVIDSEGNEITARNYVINMRIDHFVDEYMPENIEMKANFYQTFSTVEKGRFINQLYIGTSKSPEELGITEKHYLFSEIPDDEVRLLSVVNYKLIDNKSCADGKGAILIEFLDDNSKRSEKEKQVLKQLTEYFPLLEGNVSLTRLGTKREYFGGMASAEYWKDKSTNDLFDVEDYTNINPLNNGYFIGSWVKPESGISGIIQTGVEYGDIIDDIIYYGDDDDYFITHDELMNIIAHQFIPGSLGKQEHNVQFFIGKDSYYIRTKRKNYRLYHGVSDISDLIIIATNECLYDLSVGNTTLEKALETGNLEYVGEKDFLEDVIEAFDMGIESQTEQKYNYIHGKYGMKFMLALFITIMISNLAANYISFSIISPITLVIFSSIAFWKYKKINYFSTFEYFTIGIYFVLTVFGILSLSGVFSQSIDYIFESKYILLIFAVYLLSTWFINKPTTFGFFRYDYRTDYTKTKLFQKSCGGVTFIWGIIFFTISLLSFIVPNNYAALSYYIVIFGIFFTYFYPRYYVESNIDN
jgi:phytoene dehydrogenase-like protein